MALSSKIALITGAASGLGRATALRFAKAGARVALVDLPSDGLQEALDEVRSVAQASDMINAYGADVTSADEVKSVVSELGGLNAVVQCAGIAPPAKLLGKKGPHDLDMFEKVLRVNTIGTFNVMRLAAEQMVANELEDGGERGCIVNTASIAAFEGQVGQCAYASSKAAVVGLTLPAARELARSAVRVNVIAPGLMKTPMMAGLPEKVQIDLAATVPFPSRLGDPDSFAALAEHIVSNGYINGEVIRIDGSLRMSA